MSDMTIDNEAIDQHKWRVFDMLCDLSEAGRTGDLIRVMAQLRDSDDAADRAAYAEFSDNHTFKWFDFDSEQSSQVS